MPEPAALDTADASASPVPAPGNGPTPLDLHRSALRDPVALSTESATTESEIEREYQGATEQGQKDFEKTTWTIRQRYESARESARRKHGEVLGAIDAKFKAGSTTIEAETVPRVAKIDRDHESLENNVTQKLNHATWLAESVFDVAQNQAREEYKKWKERIGTHDEAMVALESQAFATIQRYAL